MTGEPGALALSELTALSPLDGRYRATAGALAPYFSEAGLVAYRVRVEVAYLEALAQATGAPLSPAEAAEVQGLGATFRPDDAARVKAIEATTRHDVKAVEYYLKERLPAALSGRLELVHLGLTSEDVNNLAQGLSLRDALREVVEPALAQVVEALATLAHSHRATPMLARTHGQPATPTTMGKEIGVFLQRLVEQLDALSGSALAGKLTGATGTFGALAVAYPDVDWLAFSEGFVRRLGLEPNLVTTQIEPRDRMAAVFDVLRRAHSILLDFAQDAWRYVSDGYLVQRPVKGEVGSSTMPHKVNPIDFENAEGNLGLANALLSHLADKLTRSRLQRDLSDSTVIRNVGVALGHAVLGYASLSRGLSKVHVDEARLRADLQAHPEVLAEAIQTAMRATGCEAPYEALKALTRGRAVTVQDLHDLVRQAPLPPECRDRLLALTPETYTGLADRVADLAVASGRRYLAKRRPLTTPEIPITP